MGYEEVKRTALVTGAGRGIGKAVAMRLAKEGIYVMAGCSRPTGYAEDTAKEIRLAA